MNYFLVIIIFLFASSVLSETITKSKTSKINLFTDKYEYEVSNTSFKVIPYYPFGNSGRMLIEETISKKEHVHMEGVESHISIKAYDCFANDSIIFLWEIKEFGEESEFKYDMVSFISYSCCSAEPTYIYYDLVSAKYLMHTTIPAKRYYDSNGGSHLIGFYSPEAITTDSLYTYSDSLAGVLRLITENDISHELVIYKANEDFEIFPTLDIVDQSGDSLESPIISKREPNRAILYYANSKEMSILDAIFSPLKKLEIPYNSDGFLIDEIDGPDEFSFIHIKR
ncbi:MAG: hypothetical protein GY865_02030 [candidate division Zixibacteria bacterium]|nr:hypothetical protein [candidate division Zixibacteria bacterium]